MKLINLLLLSSLLTLTAACTQAGEDADKATATAGKAQPTSVKKRKVPALPNFAALTDVKEKKRQFFEYMSILASNSNLAIEQERRSVLALQQQLKAKATLDKSAQATLEKLAQRYKAGGNTPQETIAKLLERVDIVPASLVLAQSANESAWGTSRFAKQGNNFFGQWCYTKGCGLVPSQRNAGASHEVRKFANPQESVEEYMLNLNTGRVYAQLRNIRQRARNKQQPITGMALAQGLNKYSERGQAYVDEIRSMIKFNKLERYDSDSQ